MKDTVKSLAKRIEELERRVHELERQPNKTIHQYRIEVDTEKSDAIWYKQDDGWDHCGVEINRKKQKKARSRRKEKK